MIGAPQCGTTSLWRALDSHPEIRVPSDKERGFFNSDRRYERGVDVFVRQTFRGAADEQLVGTVTPQLMRPNHRLGLHVERIAATSPEVRLIAMLRDPIERAISNFRRNRRVHGWPDESFDAATQRVSRRTGGLRDVLFVRGGQYGQVLRHYLEEFDREQIKILFTADLDANPARVYGDVFEFLGVDASHDAGSPRLNVGGTRRRVGEEALEELREEAKRLFATDPEGVRGFNWWLRHIWNCEPDDRGLEVSEPLRRRLAEIYLADAELLEGSFGIEVPWRAALSS